MPTAECCAVQLKRERNSEPRGQPRWQLRSGVQGRTENRAGKEQPGGRFGRSVEAGKGARGAQLLFAMSLEEAADHTKVMTTNKITRVGLQDDMYVVAEPEDLTSLLEELKIELQACGHRLRMHKCKVWFPGWDS